MTSSLSTQLFVKGIEPVEKFTGAEEQDPMTWLQTIDELFDAIKVEPVDRRRLLPMYFGDDVKKWYRSDTHSSEYTEFKKQFIHAFTSSVHRLKLSTKLMNRRQGNEESIQSYYYDILALCVRFNPDMDDNEKILYLVRGLKPSIQQQVIMSDPKKCKDLLDHAKRAEAAALVTHSTTPSPNEHIDETTAALRRMSSNQNNRPNDRNTWNNQQDDNRHWSQQQRFSNGYNSNRVRQRELSQLRCYNCRGVGHYAYQCPTRLN